MVSVLNGPSTGGGEKLIELASSERFVRFELPVRFHEEPLCMTTLEVLPSAVSAEPDRRVLVAVMLATLGSPLVSVVREKEGA